MCPGRCVRCGRQSMVNGCTKKGKWVGEFCGDCWDAVDHDPPERKWSGTTSRPNHNDPGLDDVIRALEEDR